VDIAGFTPADELDVTTGDPERTLAVDNAIPTGLGVLQEGNVAGVTLGLTAGEDVLTLAGTGVLEPDTVDDTDGWVDGGVFNKTVGVLTVVTATLGDASCGDTAVVTAGLD